MPINKLINGYKTWQEAYLRNRRAEFRRLVVHGQTPQVMMIACSDSRVDPALITAAEPGDLFVVRNVANLMPPYAPDGLFHGTSAALEFAVKKLKVRHIVILGHGLCGGIRALVDKDFGLQDDLDFIGSWMSVAETSLQEVRKRVPGAGAEATATLVEKQSIIGSVANLMTFPWVVERIESDELMIHAWYFDIISEMLTGYNAATGQWQELETPAIFNAMSKSNTPV